jgi:virginiamycin B lyase
MKRLLLLPFLIFLILFTLSCSDSPASSTSSNSTNISPALSQSTPLPATIATGTFQEYPLPQSDSGMMRPAIDHEGRIWFGEMNNNFLAYFDPRTHTFKQMIPPHGKFGIMGIQVASDDTIWFAEQYANYIGQYVPTTGQYHLYPLPTLTVPDPNHVGQTMSLPSAPNDLTIDAHGIIWFTELNADSIGHLDPHTGLIQQIPLDAQKTVQTLDPYGITIDSQGRVWVTEATSDHIICFDPKTGKIRTFTPQIPNNQLMEIVSDSHGIIWATGFSDGLLLSLNTVTGIFTPYYVPHTGTQAGGLYGLFISKTGEIWITVSAGNMIARLDVTAKRFFLYPIPTSSSLPLGLVVSSNHTIWFTEAGSNKIGMLKP